MTIDGLMISVTSSESIGVNFASETTVGYLRLYNSIIKGVAGDTNGYLCEYAYAGSTLYSKNCIFYNHYNGVYNWSGKVLYLYNATVKGCSNNGVRNNGTATCKNVLADNPAGGSDRDFAGAGTMVCTNCASSGDTADDFGGSGNRVSQTFTFVSSTDLHLQATDAGAIGYGLNLYNDAIFPFQDDIDGQDRGGAAAAWDIGADEYVSSTAIEQEGFRFRNDDGSESAATWKASQDTNISLAADTAARIRMLLNATGDPASIGAQLEYRYKPSGGAFGSWTKVN